MSLEKAAKQMKNSFNSVSSLYLLLSSVAEIANKKKKEGGGEFTTTLHTLRDIFCVEMDSSPSTKNILNYLLKNGVFGNNNPSNVLKNVSYLRKYISDTEKKISLLGGKKLNEKGKVFVFGHDTFISGILKNARSKGKSFKVHNTEMRPNFYGRKLAGELTKGGIAVHHYADSSLKRAISGADIVLCDCVSILSDGSVLGTAGFDLVTNIALTEGVPLYVCAPSWKIDYSSLFGQERQNPVNGLWGGAPNGVKINNPQFDKVNSKFITGIISELGIYPTTEFISEARYENTWGFK